MKIISFRQLCLLGRLSHLDFSTDTEYDQYWNKLFYVTHTHTQTELIYCIELFATEMSPMHGSHYGLQRSYVSRVLYSEWKWAIIVDCWRTNLIRWEIASTEFYVDRLVDSSAPNRIQNKTNKNVRIYIYKSNKTELFEGTFEDHSKCV